MTSFAHSTGVILSLALLVLFSQSHGQDTLQENPYEPLGIHQEALINLQVGSGRVPFRYAHEIQSLDRSLNASASLRVGKVVRLGLYTEYQERSDAFSHYRLQAAGSLRREEYAIATSHTQVGIKADLVLDAVIAEMLSVRLPRSLSVYHSYFLGYSYSVVEIQEEFLETVGFTGFGSDLGVSDFPSTGGDVQLAAGTTLGVHWGLPSVPLGVFAEVGFGPMHHGNVGVVVRID
jgi:hypothetical protein